MATMNRNRIALVALVALTLVAAACDSEPTNETIPPTTAGTETTVAATGSTTTTGGDPESATTSTSVPSTTTTTATTTTTTAAPGPTTFEIDYRDGVVDGPDEVAVELGTRVIIVVTADVEDDEVHLHGYDVFADIGPSSAAIIEFEATIPGIFELELEDASKVLLEIEVS